LRDTNSIFLTYILTDLGFLGIVERECNQFLQVVPFILGSVPEKSCYEGDCVGIHVLRAVKNYTARCMGKYFVRTVCLFCKSCIYE
jgi:hypothetical protein